MHLTRAAIILLCLTAPAAMAQSTLFKCVDDKGVTYYGETMPAACAKKAVTEMTKQGNIVRKVDAPLTPEQRKVQDEERAKKAVDEKRVADQRQKDLATLGTYGSEREFDIIRDKDVAQLDARKKFLEARVVDADARLEKINNKLEFYKAGKSKASKEREIPPDLLAEHERAKSDRANLDIEIAAVEVDKKDIVARYNSEKERWKKLKAGMRPGTILDEHGNVLIEGPIIRRQAATR